MHRCTTILLVLASVLIAGCAGSLPGGESGPTLDDATYPPGVHDDGVNGTELVGAHTASLENRSFVLRQSFEETLDGEQGAETGTIEAVVGPDRERLLATVNASNADQSIYLTAEKQYTRAVLDGEPTYEVRPRTSEALSMTPISYTGELFLAEFLEVANFTPSEARTIDGTTVVVLSANESDLEETSGFDVDSFEGTALVDEAGTIRSLEIQIVGTESDGRESEFSFSNEVSDLDEATVPEPDWIERAESENE